MNIGKSIRLERIISRTTHRTIIVPLDHGVTIGPVYGLVDLRHTVDQVAEGGADAVLMHKGLVRCGHREGGRDAGLIVHLSAGTIHSPSPNTKTLVGTVEEAVRVGADAVSIHVNLGDETESQMLHDFGKVSDAANSWGLPLLAMVYGRGPKIKDPFDPDVVAHCARAGVELGADVVKVNYSGDQDSFARAVDSSCIPVVIAGGPKLHERRDLIRMVHDSLEAGAAGLSVGRNVFQDENPGLLVKALHGVVHEDWSVDQAMELLQG